MNMKMFLESNQYSEFQSKFLDNVKNPEKQNDVTPTQSKNENNLNCSNNIIDSFDDKNINNIFYKSEKMNKLKSNEPTMKKEKIEDAVSKKLFQVSDEKNQKLESIVNVNEDCHEVITKDNSGGFLKRKRNRLQDDIDVSMKCYNCNQPGHTSNMCNHKRKMLNCAYCAIEGHAKDDCPLKQLCWRCNKPGHKSERCKPKNRKESNNVQNYKQQQNCTLCQRTGHERKQCMEDISGFNNKNMTQLKGDSWQGTCYICGKRGHFCETPRNTDIQVQNNVKRLNDQDLVNMDRNELINFLLVNRESTSKKRRVK